MDWFLLIANNHLFDCSSSPPILCLPLELFHNSMKQEENIQTNYYMIDFRNTYKLYYDKIKSKASLESKCLQLSLQARAELRDKISYYYGRAPKEDIILED